MAKIRSINCFRDTHVPWQGQGCVLEICTIKGNRYTALDHETQGATNLQMQSTLDHFPLGGVLNSLKEHGPKPLIGSVYCIYYSDGN
jgi:hypothetical protein